MVFLQSKAPALLVFDHGSDEDDDEDRCRVTITFDEQSDSRSLGVTGRTAVTMRQLHPTKEQRDAGIGFGAVESKDGAAIERRCRLIARAMADTTVHRTL
jgi:hypothetical protein